MDLTALMAPLGAGVVAGGFVTLAKTAVGFADRYSGIATVALAAVLGGVEAAFHIGGIATPVPDAVLAAAIAGLFVEGVTNISTSLFPKTAVK